MIKHPFKLRITRRRWLATVLATSSIGLGSCASSILPKLSAPAATYSLLPIAGDPQKNITSELTLLVSSPRASGMLNSSRILYTRRINEAAYFAQSQWVDTPSQMLLPLMASAIQRTGAFKAVLSTPTGASSQYRLETELIAFEHSFLTQPSQVNMVMRAALINTKTREVVSRSDFSATVAASTEDAYGGVLAAQKAVQLVLSDVSTFCANAVNKK